MIIINQRKTIIITILVELLFGILFFIFPVEFENLIVYVVGSLIILCGLALLFSYFKNKRKFPPQLISGLIVTLIGSLIVGLNEFITFAIPIFVALVMIGRGINKLCTSYFLRNQNRWWFVDFFSAIALIALSICLMVFNGQKIVGYLAGGFILANALIDIIHLIILESLSKENDDYLKQTFNQEDASLETDDNIIEADYTETKDEEN